MTTFQSIPRGLRGYDLLPSPAAITDGDPWTYAQTHWDSTEFAYLKSQVDAGAANGANAFRFVGNAHVTLAGLLDPAIYHAQMGALARHCQYRGCWLILVFCQAPDLAGPGNSKPDHATIAAHCGAFCKALEPFHNILGIDLYAEWQGAQPFGWSRADYIANTITPVTDAESLALIPLLRAAADANNRRHPKTVSNSTPLTDTLNASVFPYADWLDFHLYTETLIPASDVDYPVSQAPGKPLILGEFGSEGTAADVLAAFGFLSGVANRPECSGTFMWQAVDAFLTSPERTAAVLAAYASFPFRPALIPFPRRKRSH